MQVFLLTILTMVAFAANSVLNRMALTGGGIDPAGFALIRVFSGVVMLVLLLGLRGDLRGYLRQANPVSIFGLSAYMLGFSFAYVALDAGAGALILFAGVQITMFVGAIIQGKAPTIWQWIGAGVAFSGLAYFLAPAASAPDWESASLMCIAAIGWGVYSLMGQKTSEPLKATAANFSLTLPIALLVWLAGTGTVLMPNGILLAVLSGAVTSALGYTLWYRVLPMLRTASAAIAQLSVPLIAAGAGALVLAEPISLTFVLSATCVLGGIALSVLSAKPPGGR